MKQLTFMIALLLGGFSVWAQDVDVPKSVVDALKKKYVAASGAEWYESESGYEVQFTLNGKDGSANFSASGAFISSKLELDSNKLPAAVKSAIDKKYGGLSIYDLFKVEASDGTATYEVTVETEEYNTVYMLISESGKILKEELPTEPTGGEYDD